MDMESGYKAWKPSVIDISANEMECQQDVMTYTCETIGNLIKNFLLERYEVALNFTIDPHVEKINFMDDNNDSGNLIIVLSSHNQFIAFKSSNAMSNLLINLFYGAGLPRKEISTDNNTLGPISQLAISKIFKKIGFNYIDHLNQTLDFTIQPLISDEKIEGNEYYQKRITISDLSDEHYFDCIMSNEIIQLIDARINKAKHDSRKSYEIADTQVELTAYVSKQKVFIDYVSNLKPGDLIPIDSKDLVTMKLDNKVVLIGKLGKSNRQKSIKVVSNFNSLMEDA